MVIMGWSHLMFDFQLLLRFIFHLQPAKTWSIEESCKSESWAGSLVSK
jgi:hypothetical protein